MKHDPWWRFRLSGRIASVCLALIGVMPPLAAQGRPFPYVLSARDVVIAPVSIGLTVWGDALRDRHAPITRSEIEGLTPGDVNWFDRVATHRWSFDWDDRSDEYRDVVLRAALLASGVEAAYGAFRGELGAPFVVGAMFAELYFGVIGVTTVTKGLAGRRRPYVYNSSLSVDERYGIASSSENVSESFYSGHVAVAFAAATFTSTMFTDIFGRSPWSYLVWGSTLSFAALTAYARVEAGLHFPTDVIAGAAAGSAIGYLIPALHRRRATDRVSLSVSPRGLALQVRF